jgi:hypothetical protein
MNTLRQLNIIALIAYLLPSYILIRAFVDIYPQQPYGCMSFFFLIGLIYIALIVNIVENREPDVPE